MIRILHIFRLLLGVDLFLVHRPGNVEAVLRNIRPEQKKQQFHPV
jgi:hypothetical protein